MRIICISDTHLQHEVSIPPGDVLVHAGDGTFRGTSQEVLRWMNWIGDQPHAHKLVIAGNHDWLFQTVPSDARALVPDGVTYLEDCGVEIDGIKFWGTPWQPTFHDWAFNLNRGPAIAEKWRLIPDDTQVLITHGPPFGILDRIPETYGMPGSQVGCEDLTHRINSLSSLRLHVFGHIHHSYGQEKDWRGRRFVNASLVDESYQQINPPIVVDL